MPPYVTCATPNLYRQNYSVGIGTTKPSTASPASATTATTRRTQGTGIKPAVGRAGGGGGGGGGGAHLTSSYGPNKSSSFLDKAPAGSGFAAARGTKASTWNGGGGGGGGGGPGGLRRGMTVPRMGGGSFPATKALSSTLNHPHDKPHPPLASAAAAMSPLSGPQQHAPPASSGATRAYGLSSHELGAASHRGGAAGAFRSTVGRQLIGKQAEEHQGRYTIVFDLDETLVSNRMPGLRPALKRPYLDGLLKALKGKAELVLWTASIESVGRPVLRQIDPHGEYFDHAIFRNASWFHEKPNCPHTKDLRLLGRDFSKTLIVENNPFSVRLNKASAIMVPDFDRPNPADSALRKVESFLSGMLGSGKPVPQFVSEHNGLHPMKVMKGLTMRIPLSGPDPFYYVTDRV